MSFKFSKVTLPNEFAKTPLSLFLQATKFLKIASIGGFADHGFARLASLYNA